MNFKGIFGTEYIGYFIYKVGVCEIPIKSKLNPN